MIVVYGDKDKIIKNLLDSKKISYVVVPESEGPTTIRISTGEILSGTKMIEYIRGYRK